MRAVLTSYGVTAVSSVDTGGRGPGNDKKIGRPKPAIQPPKAGRQSDRFVKTWLEPLSGREEGGKGRWGGNLDGWNLKSIFFPVQTGKQANWQTGRVIDYEETWGSNKRWKTSSDGTLFFKLLKVKSFLGGWNAACIATWMTAWLVKCNECDETFLISINFKNHVKHPPLFP